MFLSRSTTVCNILLQGKELVATNVDLVTRLEGGRDNSFLGLDGEVDLVDRAQDFIDLADRGLLKNCVSASRICGEQLSRAYLVLEVDGGVEVRNLGVDGFANHLAFARMHDSSHL